MVGYPQYQMYQQQMPQMQQMSNNSQNNQIGSNGYVIVRSEEEARNYPLAPGFSMTFFDETKPYCYKKTMSYSPLDHPIFETYKIVKEEKENKPEKEAPVPEWKTDIIALQEDVENLYKEINALKAKNKSVPKRKEDVKDDAE